MESDDELPSLSSRSRVPRALTLIALSILAITVAGITYVHPNLRLGPALQTAAAPVSKLPPSDQVAALDFVTPTIGWVVVEARPNEFALLHTTDAGDTWKRQLGGPSGVIGEYMQFFDPSHGVLVLLGPKAYLYQTSDGGGSWSRQVPTQGTGYVWSADFVDANHGWLLAQASTVGEVLLRTVDGAKTWVGLGNPVAYSDWAYRVVFADAKNGWLYTQSAAPYAYRSQDGGTTWSHVPLPSPPGGWPTAPAAAGAPEKFFVAAHPTQGTGVMATVIGISAFNGHSSDSGVSVSYPPLKVSTYDSGSSVTYVYADVSPYRYASIEYVNPGPLVDTEPGNQLQLSSVDGGLSWKTISPPSTYGAIGYIDARNWWWIGSGASSTSSDAGTTWTPVRTIGVPEPLPESLQFIDASHVWFGAMAGTRPLVESSDDGGIVWKMILLPEITPP
ncbi:MAG TPA: YCF48-related protein [Clostridia bacterium]|nr:YCF48-related protein [Clostridia bacterium]